MKKILSYKLLSLIPAFIVFTSSFTLAQTGNIRFTIEKNPAQENQVLIKAKNTSASAISGILGSSNLTLCIALPSSLSGISVSIASPIVGQTFTDVLRSKFGTDSVFAWNGLGSTGSVNFPVNTEVIIASVTFDGGAPGATSLVKLMNVTNGGTGFDYNYIAPGGNEHSGYSTPFYSNVASDPLLLNCGGPNDAFNQCNSYLGVGAVSLPVKFLSFFALKNGNDAKLNWTVESDENNRHFEVERSVDGRVFKSFAKVDAKGNGKSVNTYELTDADISKLGVNLVYYRIKQTDKNGELTYSNVKNLNNVKKSTPVQLFPNPVKAITKVVVDVDAPGKGSIVIRDMAGKMVRQINTLFIKGINQQDLNVAELASGEYTIQVIGEGFSHQLKLTKVN